MTPEMVSLKRKINFLQALYLVLFITSLVLIVVNTQRHAASSAGEYAWAVALGSAVVTRLVRQSLVAKYNTAVMGGRPGPLT